ncbi:MAG: TIGR01777 family protein [Candidatus Omnitrophica bacterium CG11_big_fil_rev_8_21_14_0_20_45_26]|uniref:TIGR01777 family protein n=1 Tax=Candidatus Abzuiibacterium crystallinum TaxID=1974748 RepID=A0A2H0LRG7_9BACT|nr:MAG: TIGR01777 family protein [Candidatus Omnitrophica bacterium CG11_big_fil_rev_8_21_14_0_20_45_26]PIW65706.1 MAG: TIGR01777 family protein [Candidatus Omnitrophica bacterium CG12_big_fil_rev_8_21_14_0_65_45_16]
MKILIAGGTGFVGKKVVQSLLNQNHQLIVLTRQGRSSRANNLRYVKWNPFESSAELDVLNGCDAVINLAGESIANKRWSASQKDLIQNSRIKVTQAIVSAVEKAPIRPKVLINASAVGFYGFRGSEEITEASRGGEGFLSEVCRSWEGHAMRAEGFGVRVVRLRLGVILGKDGGAFQRMALPFRLMIGGWLGDGNQWMSWIHIEDVVRLILFCLEHHEASGVINAVAPQPVTNKAFSLVLAQVLKRPCLLPVPAVLLKFLLGEMAENLLLGSQRIVPQRAKEIGFSFRYPDIRQALESIIH